MLPLALVAASRGLAVAGGGTATDSLALIVGAFVVTEGAEDRCAAALRLREGSCLLAEGLAGVDGSLLEG
jgi:hypothetical protein